MNRIHRLYRLCLFPENNNQLQFMVLTICPELLPESQYYSMESDKITHVVTNINLWSHFKNVFIGTHTSTCHIWCAVYIYTTLNTRWMISYTVLCWLCHISYKISWKLSLHTKCLLFKAIDNCYMMHS